MKQIKQKTLIIGTSILLILFLFSGCSNPEPPKLVLSEDSWYYGKVTPDQRPTHDFIIKNEGEEKLVIEAAYPSCPCIILDLNEKEILPGEEALLKTTFDPTGYEGKVSKLLTVKSNDPENPEQRIEATITVLRVPNPDIELSEQIFDLGTVSRKDISRIQFIIYNRGDADLIIEEILAEDLFSYNLVTPLRISPGDQFQAELYMEVNQLKEGEFRKAIRILTNDPQNLILFLRFMGNLK